MAISNFIPTIWSETLAEELDKKYIAIKNCNRQFEGDIKSKGNTVKICDVGDIIVSDYEKYQDMSAPQELSETMRELVIDQAKCFNFEIDDIDKAQAVPDLMQGAMKKAASALANEADKYIFSLTSQCKEENVVNYGTVSHNDIVDCLLSVRTRLLMNNVYDADEMVFEVSPEIGQFIMKAKLNISSNNRDVLENGCIGSLFGTKIYVSNNIELDGLTYHCVARTKRSVAFAEQLSEIEAYRPESRFADAVKGLHLYGAKIVYPDEYFVINLSL